MGLFRAHTAIIQTLLSSLSATLSFTFSTTCTPYVTLILHSCFHLMRCVFAPTLFHSQLFFFSISSLSLLFSSLVFSRLLPPLVLYYNYNFCSVLFPLSLNALPSLFLSSFPPFLPTALHSLLSFLTSSCLTSSRLVLSCLVRPVIKVGDVHDMLKNVQHHCFPIGQSQPPSHQICSCYITSCHITSYHAMSGCDRLDQVQDL